MLGESLTQMGDEAFASKPLLIFHSSSDSSRNFARALRQLLAVFVPMASPRETEDLKSLPTGPTAGSLTASLQRSL